MQLVLDAVVDYLPAPTEVDPQPLTDPETGEATGEVATVSADEPLKALAFKIMDDRFGALTFVRIYSGRMKKVTQYLTQQQVKLSVSAVWLRCKLTTVTRSLKRKRADIIAVVGMKNVQTGHTLCDPKHECTLEAMIFPDPVISIAVAPKDKGGNEKMEYRESVRWLQKILHSKLKLTNSERNHP